MSILVALFVLFVAMAAGDFVSDKTKAFVPSVFVSAILFLIGYWTFFPKDIVNLSTLGQPFAGVAMYFLIVHMGSLMNLKELSAQWKGALISFMAVVGIMVFLMTVGILILGRETAIVGAPPLTGGIVAALLMQKAAAEAGKETLAILAILVYVVQGFVGYPLTAILLKKEANRLLEGYHKGERLAVVHVEEASAKKENFFTKFNEKNNSVYFVLLRTSVVAILSDLFTKFVNTNIFHKDGALSPFVTCLIFGVIFAEIGFLERRPLEKSNSFGWFMTALMVFVLGGLNNATPEMLKQVALPLLGVIVIGVIGLILFAFVSAKVLKESPAMAIAIGLNALYGFPPNYIITTEVIKSVQKNEEEKEYLTSILLPKMLIGGFVSVTIASVIIGGIFSSLL